MANKVVDSPSMECPQTGHRSKNVATVGSLLQGTVYAGKQTEVSSARHLILQVGTRFESGMEISAPFGAGQVWITMQNVVGRPKLQPK